MTTYRIALRLEVSATAYVNADSPEEALAQAKRGRLLSYLEEGGPTVLRIPDPAHVAALPAGDDTHAEAVLRGLLERAHAHAEAMSQVHDHPVLHLLDAALVLLGAPGFNREKALQQAKEAIHRAVGDNPPTWAQMRALLNDALEQLDTLYRLTVSLDDGQGTVEQDWSETRNTADDLGTRIRALLDRMDKLTGVPTVRVDVRSGVASLVSKPYGVAVEIRDYDQEGADPGPWELQHDPDGGCHFSREYAPADGELTCHRTGAPQPAGERSCAP